MEKEKVWYINLPDGAVCQRVEVTAEGRIGIVYTEQCVNNKETIIVPFVTALPKPTPLIGGTEVYQKDNGTPYWYCKIKKGRDEFMYLYFGDLTEDDLIYDEDGKPREFTTNKQKEFKANVLKALKNKPKKGFTWIPVYEASSDGKGSVQYVSEENVLRGLNRYQWEEILKAYSPENGSHMASVTTNFLLLLRWLKDGLGTVERLSINPKEIGYFLSNDEFEKTDGGLKGFAGNTYKIVKDSESSSGFSFLSGGYNVYACVFPVGDDLNSIIIECCAAVSLVELDK